MGTWSAFVINLGRAPERWHHVSRQLGNAGIAFTRVEAIDGAALSFPMPEFSARSYRLLHGRRVNPFEVGCYLSHLAAMDAFLATDHDWALILEDDIAIATDLPRVIEAALAYGEDWDILRLSTVNRGRWFTIASLGNGERLALCFTREKGAGGYMLSRRAAAVLRRRLLPMRLAYDIAFDLEFFWGLRALGVYPLPIRQKTGFRSQIQPDVSKLPGWRYLSVFPYRAAVETSRIFARGALYGWLRLKHVGQRSAGGTQLSVPPN